MLPQFGEMLRVSISRDFASAKLTIGCKFRFSEHYTLLLILRILKYSNCAGHRLILKYILDFTLSNMPRLDVFILNSTHNLQNFPMHIISMLMDM